MYSPPDEQQVNPDIVLPEYQDPQVYIEENSPPDLVDPERVNRFSVQRPAESDTDVADLIEQIDAELEEPIQADGRIEDEDHQEHQQQQSDQNLSSCDRIAHDLEERERLDAEWEKERLEQELNITQPAETPQPQPEVSQEIPPPGGNNSNQEQPVTEPDVESTAVALRADGDVLNDSSGSTSLPRVQPTVSVENASDQMVTIRFWSWDHGNLGGPGRWTLADSLTVDCRDPSHVGRVALKYRRKHWALYDEKLQCLSPAQCFRAAMTDKHNRIFIISKKQEERLASQGRIDSDK
ncbi:hypothetical protein AJ78_08072 [Emergomyces pasteurianus Ep9510]|uniref:Uncharacterized protein n=1 Tax=Emergomyces pasteurianus Ep9510 TaxID=1447872 RepID=A0A1J9Q4A1_9EURO|nr:hypothetical protein AJ78_08072 [Emergomyces pasteurianus Ep9510]